MSIVSTSVTELLKKTEQLFSEAKIPSPRLDAEILLAYLLEVKREWLVAHNDEQLSTDIKNVFELLVKRRLNREPIAYIVGRKEFYGREFIVTPDVLIPRPETETLIDVAKKHIQPNNHALDVGTGSGCVGVTLKLEYPNITMTLGDISKTALSIARKNAHVLGAKPIRFVVSDLLSHWLGHEHPKQFNMIIANLPYVDTTWETSPETAHEPTMALYAESGGLALIYKLIEQSTELLAPNGILLLEADPEQHSSITAYAVEHGFILQDKQDYALALQLAT